MLFCPHQAPAADRPCLARDGPTSAYAHGPPSPVRSSVSWMESKRALSSSLTQMPAGRPSARRARRRPTACTAIRVELASRARSSAISASLAERREAEEATEDMLMGFAECGWRGWCGVDVDRQLKGQGELSSTSRARPFASEPPPPYHRPRAAPRTCPRCLCMLVHCIEL